MPTIFLKPNSAEYEEATRPHTQVCDMPGCREEASHKAPKDRDLQEYYRFCFTHVQEYNKAWNYFSGMSNAEVQEQILRSYLGDRPTWKYADYKNLEDVLRYKAQQTYHNLGQKEFEKEKKRRQQFISPHSPEYEALTIMGLEPPLDLNTIKARYKELAKKHHPDVNNGCKKAEDLLKQINMAYTILRLAHEKFAKLETRQR